MSEERNTPNRHTIAQAKYDKSNTIRYALKLNKTTDADVIKWLAEQKSMQGAIKKLVRDEITRSQEFNTR
jgi:hypothetical protein